MTMILNLLKYNQTDLIDSVWMMKEWKIEKVPSANIHSTAGSVLF
jgi:hypothetical protein